MTRVSLEEQYNNKDVITQILKMRDDIARIAANAAGIQDITLTTTATGWKFTFTLTDGTSYVFPLDTTGYITDAEFATALASYYNKTEIDNAFANYYTKGEIDTALGAKANDNAVVKLSGAQTVAGIKTFTSSPKVPDTPLDGDSAVNQDWAENAAYDDDTVNNLVHKEGNEQIKGVKDFHSTAFSVVKISSDRTSGNSGGTQFIHAEVVDDVGVPVVNSAILGNHSATKNSCRIIAYDNTLTEKSGLIVSYELDNNVSYVTASDRNSAVVSDYGNGEVVTINVLKKLGLI